MAPDTVELNPFALIATPTFQDVPAGGEDPPSVAFRARAYTSRASYWLYSGGRRIGAVTGIAPAEPACTGLPGTAKPHVDLPPSWVGLAASDSNLGTNTTRRDLTPREDSDLRKLIQAKALELAPRLNLDSLRTTDAWAIDFPGGRSWLIAGYQAVDPADTVEYSEVSILVLSENGTHAAPPLLWSHRGGETSRKVRRPVDVLDLDRDGVPEVITSTSYYESWDYQIWQYRPVGWVELVESTGSAGC